MAGIRPSPRLRVSLLAISLTALVASSGFLSEPFGTTRSTTAPPVPVPRAHLPTVRTAAGPPVPDWYALNASVAPTARWYVPTAFDVAEDVLVVAGGFNGAQAISDTWTYSNGSWTNLTPALSLLPPPLIDIVYDGAIGALVGVGDSGPICSTWEFRNLAWTNVTPAYGPSPRIRAMMTYDASLQGVLLFGGASSPSSGPLGDTWLFKGGAWTNLTPSPSPPARARGMLTWDPQLQEDLLFGGFSVYGQPDLGDTWAFRTGAWVNVTPVMSPSPRDGAMLRYDPNSGAVILFGGFYTDSSLAQGTDSDTWEFLSAGWVQLFPTTAPGPRALAGADYDAADHCLVLVDGYLFGGTPLNDTWAWAWPMSSATIAQSPPEAVAAHAIRFNASFGGGLGPFGYSWVFGGGGAAAGPTPTHTFPGPGTYAANVTIRDSLLGSISATRSVVVVSAGLAITGISHTPAEVVVGYPVTFSSSISGGKSPFAYSWAFGDGSSATGSSAAHAYALPEAVDGSLAVEDNLTALAVRAFSFEIASELLSVSAIQMSPSLGIAGAALTLNATASGGIAPYSYVWSFGDGTTSNGSPAPHSYASPGTYIATVTVRDAGNGTTNASRAIVVNAPPGEGGSGGFGLPWIVWGVIAAAVAAGAAAAGIAVRRRSRSRAPKS